MAAKNKMEDLRNHLFEQLERLSDTEIDLDKEIERAKAVCGVAQVLVSTAKVEVDLVVALEANGASDFFPQQDSLLQAGETEQLARGFGNYGLKLRESKKQIAS